MRTKKYNVKKNREAVAITEEERYVMNGAIYLFSNGSNNELNYSFRNRINNIEYISKNQLFYCV